MGAGGGKISEFITVEPRGKVHISGRKQPITFANGLRVDKNIVNTDDYFFYHFFRMLELATKNSVSYPPRSTPRIIRPSPREYSSPRLPESKSDNTLNFQLTSASSLPEEALFALDAYVDDTNFRCQLSLRSIRTMVEECYFIGQNSSKGKINYMFDAIKSFCQGNPRDYFYNYRPIAYSNLGVIIAHHFDWQNYWFRLPGTYYHLNEWDYLFGKDLALYEYCNGGNGFLQYFLLSLPHNKSNVSISESKLREALGRKIPTSDMITKSANILVELKGKVRDLDMIGKVLGF